MKVTIHQALCGEHNKAWDLLNTTLPDISLAKRIAFQTDLQDSPPSGISWSPALRGFSFDNYFLIIKTYPDNSPDVRNGRVFSHCLIINKKDILQLPYLSEVLSHFGSSINKHAEIDSLVIDVGNTTPTLLDGELELRFNKVIKSFMAFINKKQPIIWIGQNQYELAVSKLWQMLAPSQREEFTFGINFNPSEVAKDKLSFIATADNLENRFSNKGFVIIGKQDRAQLTEFSDQFIAGHENAISRIENFVSEIGGVSPSTADVSIIAKGIPTYEGLSEETDLKRLNTLAIIVATYSPNEETGSKAKAKIVNRIGHLLKNADEGDVYLFRNFKFEAFKNSEEVLGKSIVQWCKGKLFSIENNERHNYTELIRQVLQLPQTNWLSKVIRRAIATFLSEQELSHAKIFWLWLGYQGEILEDLDAEIPTYRWMENNLVRTIPQLKNGMLVKIKVWSLQRRWLILYASLLKSSLSFSEALNDWLEYNTDEFNTDGLDILLKDVSESLVIEASVKHGDKRLISLSGQLCHAHPEHLQQLRIQDANWQQIWLKALENGNKVSDGLLDIGSTIDSIWDALISGANIHEGLLSRISQTEFGNIWTYPNRKELWRYLPGSVKDNCLKKTALYFLSALSKNPALEAPADKDLNGYIQSTAITAFLSANRSDINIALTIFFAYPNLPEYVLRDYVERFSGNLNHVNAVQLGQLVFRRGFSNVASAIFDRCSFNKQYRMALAECYGLLSFASRGFAWIAGWVKKEAISEDEWWKHFTEIAYSLYQGGPNENKIWVQAGGKDFDLLTKGTGKEVWIAAIQKLRKKDFSGDISVKKLLKAMIAEHKKNESLKNLKDFWDKL